MSSVAKQHVSEQSISDPGVQIGDPLKGFLPEGCTIAIICLIVDIIRITTTITINVDLIVIAMIILFSWWLKQMT